MGTVRAPRTGSHGAAMGVLLSLTLFFYLFKDDLCLLLNNAPACCTLGMVALGAQVGTSQLPTWHGPCGEGFADLAWSHCLEVLSF